MRYLLGNYNNGRQKSFFCISVNLLELNDLKFVMEQIETQTTADNLSLKEKSIIAVELFQTMAEKRNIVLKLNKKPKKSK